MCRRDRYDSFDMFRTFHFTQPTVDSLELLDRVHFLYLALHREEKQSFSENAYSGDHEH